MATNLLPIVDDRINNFYIPKVKGIVNGKEVRRRKSTNRPKRKSTFFSFAKTRKYFSFSHIIELSGKKIQTKYQQREKYRQTISVRKFRQTHGKSGLGSLDRIMPMKKNGINDDWFR